MRLVKEAPDFLGNPRRFAFNYSLVESVLDTLTPERLVLFLGTHHLNFSSSGLGPPDDNPPPEQNSSPINFPWPELDQKEPIYSTPFSSIDTPPELLEYWGSLTPVPQNLSLPGKNYFIPTNFDLLKPPSNLSDTPSRVSVGELLSSPVILHDIYSTVYYSGTSDKGPSEIGTASLQRTLTLVYYLTSEIGTASLQGTLVSTPC